MTWTVEDGTPYMTVRTAGRFNADDHQTMVADIVGRPFWHPGRDVLFDHRALSFSGTGYAAMAAALQNHLAFDRKIGDGRAAILMANPADFGVGRIFESIASDEVRAELRVFLDEGAAREWLTIPRLQA